MIRLARPDDAAGICAVWNPIIRDSAITFNPVEKTEAAIAALIADRAAAGHAVMVAEDGGTVLGFASYGQFRAGLGYARTMEHSINLSPAAQGRGIGARLLRAIEDHARAGGAHVMVGAVTASNAPSVAFHRRMGYSEVGLMPDAGYKFGRYHDLLLMQKILD